MYQKIPLAFPDSYICIFLCNKNILQGSLCTMLTSNACTTPSYKKILDQKIQKFEK